MATEAKQRILNELKVTTEERDYIARETVGLFNNDLYKKERANRLTASDFGEVIKRRSTTNPDRFVRDILSIEPNVNAPGIQFAKDNEEDAIKLFEEKMNMKVQRIGLYIDIDNPYLAASPTGLIGDDSLLKVSYGYKANNVYEVSKDKTKCLEVTSENEIRLKRNHKVYYQIQGQLSITKRDVGYFMYFIDKGTDPHIERIERDSNLWTNDMLPKLKEFYMSYVLPEIAKGEIQ